MIKITTWNLGTFQRVVEQIKSILINFFNKMIPRLVKPETYILFIVDYGL
jgi:hypothetical protein